MTRTGLTMLERITTLARMAGTIGLGLTATALGGCINVSAPNKPIEINLNISVTQEVVYRLDGEAKSLIQQNPGIF
jgi:hypothetical protein